jgi:hypothetical protein
VADEDVGPSGKLEGLRWLWEPQSFEFGWRERRCWRHGALGARRRPPVADPVAGAGGAVAGVGEPAAAEREAAAADALGEAGPEALELGDAGVDAGAPSGREARPVAAGRHLVCRQLRQLGADLIEAEADTLGEDDEGDPAQDRARVAAVAGARPLFKVGKREIGHLHGDRSAHFFFPKETWVELHEQGRIGHHPVFPDRQGPAARRIESEADVADMIALMRLNYDDAVRRCG